MSLGPDGEARLVEQAGTHEVDRIIRQEAYEEGGLVGQGPLQGGHSQLTDDTPVGRGIAFFASGLARPRRANGTRTRQGVPDNVHSDISDSFYLYCLG